MNKTVFMDKAVNYELLPYFGGLTPATCPVTGGEGKRRDI